MTYRQKRFSNFCAARAKFPEDRFVKYEAKDEEWCRYFGIGREVEVSTTLSMPRARLVSFDGEYATFVGTTDSGPMFQVSEGVVGRIEEDCEERNG